MTRRMTPEEERFEDELSYVANMSEEEVARERIAMTAKVAELQALVDAALAATTFQETSDILMRARDLAKKGPT